MIFLWLPRLNYEELFNRAQISFVIPIILNHLSCHSHSPFLWSEDARRDPQQYPRSLGGRLSNRSAFVLNAIASLFFFIFLSIEEHFGAHRDLLMTTK